MSETLKDTHEDWGLTPAEYAVREKTAAAARQKDVVARNLAVARALARTQPAAARPAPARLRPTPPRSPIARDLGIRSVSLRGVSVPYLDSLYGEGK